MKKSRFKLSKPFKFLLTLLACVSFSYGYGILGVNAQIPRTDATVLSVPAEFERQEAIWLLWPTLEYKQGYPPADVSKQIIQALAGYEKINLGVQDAEEIKNVKQFLRANNISDRHVKYQIVPHADMWARDVAPIFAKSDRSPIVPDFSFNFWGYEEPTSELSTTEEKVDRIIANLLKIPTLKSNVISEGGNKEFNGKGILMLTEAVEFQRNPGMSRLQLEREYQRTFGVKKFIWLKQGIYEDDLTFKGTLPSPDGQKNVFTVYTTGGHIDEFARFVSPDTIALVEVTEEEAARDPIAKVNRARMEENYQILKAATDSDGKPFNIVRMPATEPIFNTLKPGDSNYEALQDFQYEDGTVFPQGEEIKVIEAASYLNFAITNKVILAQSFWQPGRAEIIKQKDERSREILQQLFPNRKIVQINAENVNLGGGGIHCITQHQPVLN